jgi:hypothetical protein
MSYNWCYVKPGETQAFFFAQEHLLISLIFFDYSLSLAKYALTSKLGEKIRFLGFGRKSMLMNHKFEGDIVEIKKVLYSWLKRQIPQQGIEWLDKKMELIASSSQKKDIYLAFSTASKNVGKSILNLSEMDLKDADKARKDWMPEGWTSDQAARILLILSVPQNDFVYFSSILKQLFETAEVSELTSLYLGLPLYPFPEELKPRAIEGFRTNISTVFNAIALNNPYPKNHLDEAAWNQMVLKAIFIGSPLYKIQGLDERSNLTLSGILSDFAHERWAAGRPITPEIWRAAGIHITDKIFNDLKKVIEVGDPLERAAAALALSKSNRPESKSLLNRVPGLVSEINKGEITWEKLGKEIELKSNK